MKSKRVDWQSSLLQMMASYCKQWWMKSKALSSGISSLQRRGAVKAMACAPIVQSLSVHACLLLRTVFYFVPYRIVHITIAGLYISFRCRSLILFTFVLVPVDISKGQGRGAS